MDLGERLLDELSPGQLLLVLGPPGSGVSSALMALAAAASGTCLPTVMASWEQSPTATRERLEDGGVTVPQIVGWDIGELISSAAFASLKPGALVAIDYLQLVTGGDSDGAKVGTLRALARGRDLRVAGGSVARFERRSDEDWITGWVAPIRRSGPGGAVGWA